MARRKSTSADPSAKKTSALKPGAKPAPSASEEPVPPQTLAFPVVGVGASAGGLEAFTQLLRALPTDTGMAFVLVPHIDSSQARLLIDMLMRATAMPVHEVSAPTLIAPNHVYVLLPGSSMILSGGMLKPSLRREPRGAYRPIDLLLRSLAEEQRHTAIGIVLSGTASDGTLGLEEIKGEGGITFAQDGTAQFDGMPRSAIAAGCVDFVLPPDGIAAELARIACHPYLSRQDATLDVAPEAHLTRILEILHNVTGVDFLHYKRSTIFRRTTRRMVLHKKEGLKDYVRLLQSSIDEVQALFQDILINVTSFFRNPEGFEILKTRIFPRLIQDHSRHEPVRIWVVGCSTGEEAYSLAIAFSEFADTLGQQIPLQIFATDLNGAAIEKARAGVYSKSITQDVAPERLRRFFVEVDGNYQICKATRDLCVFARHNVLVEPPFSRMDLISCRNLLIYLDGAMQQKVMPTLHYALKPGGVLWLGSSETIGSCRDLFDFEDPKHKFYVKKAVPSRLSLYAPLSGISAEFQRLGTRASALREAGAVAAEAQKEADRIVLAKFAPPGVLVNGELEILQFRGDTGLFLSPAPGRASLNLLKMLREGLLLAVRAAISEARREGAPVRKEDLRVKANGSYRTVSVEVIPIKGNVEGDGSFLVLFEEADPAKKWPQAQPAEPSRDQAEAEEAEREIARLKQELAATREYLQSVIEQQEAANEELQSANEEVQSANEELQSINEELETSKEEIQSSNEELATVNEELHNRNLELSLSNNDLLNLLSSVQMAIVMLGPDLRIRRFTPMAERMLNLIPADVGRPIGDINLTLHISDMESLLEEVIDTVSVREREVQDKQGRWYSMRLRPYRTLENKIDGAVLVLVDIDTLKRNQEVLRRQTELLEQTHEPILAWDFDGAITYWNRGAEEIYGYTREQALGRTPGDLFRTSGPCETFSESLKRDGQWTGELIHTRRDGQKIVVESSMALLTESDGSQRVVETNRPITERKQMEEALRHRAETLLAADRSRNEFLATLAHELRNPLSPLRNAVELLKISSDRGIPAGVLELMERQIRNMARMVDDLLDGARITSGQIQLRKGPLELVSTVSRIVELFRPRCESQNQRLSLSLPSAPIFVQGDEVRIEQVLSNLLNNASKFSGSDGQLWVSLAQGPAGSESGEGRRSEAIIRVRDNGVGIPEGDLPRIFDLFMQGDAALNRQHGGLGIGLTLVRKLVDLHGGTVEAKSAGRGQGSEFIVRLPIESAAAPIPRSPEPMPVPSVVLRQPDVRRILIVDDNVDAANTSAVLLRHSGHEVEVAYSGPAALELVSQLQPDVALIDISLPGMDGYEVARHMRAQEGLGKMTLIAVSGYGREDLKRWAQDSHFDEYLTKPVDVERLNELLPQLASLKNS